MNETIQVIRSRRSIRKYRPEMISDSEIKAIIHAAIYAPSARNQQAWHFTVVRDPAMMCRLRETQKTNMLRNGNETQVQRASEPGYVAFHNAPMLIIISADEKVRSALIDCGAAAENIALAAESLDIGTCLMTSSEMLFANDTDGILKNALGIPEGYRHVMSVSLGYKDCEQPKPAPRRENIVNYL
jgi:nitroreductase